MNTSITGNFYALVRMHVCIFAIAVSFLSFSQNWTGNTNSNWNTNTNWQGNVLPAGLNVVIDPVNFTGAAASPIISVNSTFTPVKIDVQNAAVLTIQADLSTTDKITVKDPNSRIDMSAGTVNIAIALAKNLDVKDDAIFNFSGGTITVGKDMNADKGGRFNMTAGTLNVTAKLKIKDKSTTTATRSVFDLDAGIVTVTSDLELDGKSTTSNPLVDISGGTFTVNGNTLWKGAGTDFPNLNISGGTVLLVGNVNNSGANIDIDISLASLLTMQGNLNMTVAADRFDQSGTSSITFQNAKNWTNAGIFTSTGGTVFNDGNTALLGVGTFTFYNLTINNTKTMNQSGPANITVNGDWTNNSGTFTPNANTVTFNGSIPQSIGGTSSTTFNNLVINNTSTTGITLNNSVTVNTSLTLSGGIVYTTSANLLTLIDNATSSSGSSTTFVDGPMKKTGNDSFTFPVGEDIAPAGIGAEDVWARLTISAPATATTQFTAQYFGSSYSDLTVDGTLVNVSSVEYWTLDRAINADNVQVTLYWENAARSGITDPVSSDLVVASYGGIDFTSECQGAISGASPGWVRSFNAIMNFNKPFTFGSSAGANPLPIELLSFSAELVSQEHAKLNWLTASEINNDFFTIEKSKDGLFFIPVGNVQGAGNSTTINTYSLDDNAPFSGVSYYRLSQTDYNGSFSYSELITLNNTQKSQTKLLI